MESDKPPSASLKAHLAVAVIEALRKVALCARCTGSGYFLYFNSDGSGADKYDCQCMEVKKALAEYDALVEQEAKA